MIFMRRFFIFLSVICFLFIFSLFGSAASFSSSVYGDTSYNSSQAMNLYSMFLNSDEYDPFAHYVIFRGSQYDYHLIVEQRDDTCLVYTYNSQNGITDHYSVSSFDSYVINNSSSYTVLSNMDSFDNALRSSTIETYIFQYIAVRVLPLLAVVILFSVFRNVFNPYKRGYDI